jgi:hypothetical protein
MQVPVEPVFTLIMGILILLVPRLLNYLVAIYSPFAPSGSDSLNFKLPIESGTQSQPLQDLLL